MIPPSNRVYNSPKFAKIWRGRRSSGDRGGTRYIVVSPPPTLSTDTILDVAVEARDTYYHITHRHSSIAHRSHASTSTTSTSSWHEDLCVGLLVCVIVDIDGHDVAQKANAQMGVQLGGIQTPLPHTIWSPCSSEPDLP